MQEMWRGNNKMKDATITISTDNYSTDISETIKKGTQFIGVDFWGHNEGSCSPCDSEEEAQKQIKYLLNRYSKDYRIKIVDERIKQEVLNF